MGTIMNFLEVTTCSFQNIHSMFYIGFQLLTLRAFGEYFARAIETPLILLNFT